jgi:hypothetical protein
MTRARAQALWPWLPLLFAAAYLVVLLTSFRSLVQGIYLNADVVSAPYIGELYGQAPAGAEVVLGNFPWYTTLWFEQLTHGLPAHRQIWELGPWAFSLLGVATVAWSANRVAGRWAAMLVAVVLACAGPALLGWQFAASIHALTFVHVCLLGAFLVWLAGRPGGWLGRPAVHWLICALVAGVTAAGFASDRLLLIAGLVPFALAGVALGFLVSPPAGRRIALSAVLVAVAAGVGGRIIAAIMEGQHVVAHPFDVFMAGFERLAPNVRILAQSLAYLFNGDFGGMRPDADAALALACAAVLAAAVVVVVRHSRRSWRAPRRATVAPEAARVAYVAFWSLAATILAAAFVLTTVPVDRYTSRYVVTVGYAIFALVPLAAAARWWPARALLTAGACVIVLGSTVGLAHHDIQHNPNNFPTGSVSGPLARLAKAEHVTYGYAGYWDAAPLTWQTKASLQLYPVAPCDADKTRLCPFTLHRISSWYVPRPGTRSLLVVDHLQPSFSPGEPGNSFGPPDRVASIGQLTVYIYPYDIARRFSSA